MNRKLCLLLLSPIILTSAGCNTNGESGAKKVDVIIISGQSNAVGCTYSEYIEASGFLTVGNDDFIIIHFL